VEALDYDKSVIMSSLFNEPSWGEREDEHSETHEMNTRFLEKQPEMYPRNSMVAGNT
jgi:hypothetical protein